MPLEDITAGGTIATLVTTNPDVGDDTSQGDDHIRNIKKALQQTFPNISATASGVAAEFAYAHKGGTVSGNSVLKGSLTIEGTVSFSATAVFGGALVAGSTASISGALVAKTSLTVEGTSTFSGTAVFTSPIVAGGTLSVSGASVMKSSLDVSATLSTSLAKITGGSVTGITDITIADGGTGASTAAGARTNLGAVNIAGDTMTGNLTITGAADPRYSVVDSTNSVTTYLQSADTAGYVGTQSAHNVGLMTNGIGRVWIDTNGNFGIATETPVSRLEVEDNGTSAGMIVKITADDGNPYGLVIGNDTYSVGDTDGLAMLVGDAGASYIMARGSGASLLIGTADVNNVITIAATETVNILAPDNQGDAFTVKQSTNSYIDVDTTDASENITFGNATTNPTFTFSGSGTLALPSGGLASDLPVASGGTGVSAMPNFLATGTGATLVASGTNYKLTCGTEVFDSNSNFALSAFTPTVAGKYFINAIVSYTDDGTQAGYSGQLKIYKNGSSYLVVKDKIDDAVSDARNISISALITMNGSTDYIELYGWQQAGDNINMSVTEFSGFWVGP